MRIIGGRWKGRRLETPPGIRPMLDRERERLFGILGSRIEDSRFLDVFAGSGAIGLEALSRGASRCTAVENGRRVLPVLRRNSADLADGANHAILEISAFALPRCGEPPPGTVDVACAAPPFPLLRRASMQARFCSLFAHVRDRLLAEDGVFVLEHPADLDPAGPSGLGPPGDTRRTAASAISLWQAESRP